LSSSGAAAAANEFEVGEGVGDEIAGGRQVGQHPRALLRGQKGAHGTDAEAGRGPGTRHSVRRFYVMSARELNEIDRDILEVRQYVEHQREIIRQLATGGQSQAIPEAQKALDELQVKLQGLLARRRALLQDLRRTSSIASDSDGPDRQSGGA
jgi:hypothetical protein